MVPRRQQARHRVSVESCSPVGSPSSPVGPGEGSPASASVFPEQTACCGCRPSEAQNIARSGFRTAAAVSSRGQSCPGLRTECGLLFASEPLNVCFMPEGY